jgi:hypothetical protein
VHGVLLVMTERWGRFLRNMLCRSHNRAIGKGSQVARVSGGCPLCLSYVSPSNPNLTSSSYESGNKVWSPYLPEGMKGTNRNDRMQGQKNEKGKEALKLFFPPQTPSPGWLLSTF